MTFIVYLHSYLTFTSELSGRWHVGPLVCGMRVTTGVAYTARRVSQQILVNRKTRARATTGVAYLVSRKTGARVAIGVAYAAGARVATAFW